MFNWGLGEGMFNSASLCAGFEHPCIEYVRVLCTCVVTLACVEVRERGVEMEVSMSWK